MLRRELLVTGSAAMSLAAVSIAAVAEEPSITESPLFDLQKDRLAPDYRAWTVFDTLLQAEDFIIDEAFQKTFGPLHSTQLLSPSVRPNHVLVNPAMARDFGRCLRCVPPSSELAHKGRWAYHGVLPAPREPIGVWSNDCIPQRASVPFGKHNSQSPAAVFEHDGRYYVKTLSDWRGAAFSV